MYILCFEWHKLRECLWSACLLTISIMHLYFIYSIIHLRFVTSFFMYCKNEKHKEVFFSSISIKGPCARVFIFMNQKSMFWIKRKKFVISVCVGGGGLIQYPRRSVKAFIAGSILLLLRLSFPRLALVKLCIVGYFRAKQIRFWILAIKDHLYITNELTYRVDQFPEIFLSLFDIFCLISNSHW